MPTYIYICEGWGGPDESHICENCLAWANVEKAKRTDLPQIPNPDCRGAHCRCTVTEVDWGPPGGGGGEPDDPDIIIHNPGPTGGPVVIPPPDVPDDPDDDDETTITIIVSPGGGDQ